MHKHTDTAQYTFILNHLRSKGSITQAEAYKLYGCLRLGALIFNMRSEGYDIDTQIVYSKNRYGNITHFAKYIWKGNEND